MIMTWDVFSVEMLLLNITSERTIVMKYYIRGVLILFAFCGFCNAENIDPYNDGSQYSFGENVGWVNFELSSVGAGCQVSSAELSGYIWAENVVWINLSPENYGGVYNDGNGNLSGYAWSENCGWINFDPHVEGDGTDYGVKIDPDGKFYGYAWGENIGWINFSLNNYYVKACKVGLEDLRNFASDWLESGALPGNLDGSGGVDVNDFDIFASYWMEFCPDGWQLKN